MQLMRKEFVSGSALPVHRLINCCWSGIDGTLREFVRETRTIVQLISRSSPLSARTGHLRRSASDFLTSERANFQQARGGSLSQPVVLFFGRGLSLYMILRRRAVEITQLVIKHNDDRWTDCRPRTW